MKQVARLVARGLVLLASATLPVSLVWHTTAHLSTADPIVHFQPDAP